MFVRVVVLAGTSIEDSHGDTHIICLALDSCPETLNCAIATCELHVFSLFYSIQCYPSTSSALPTPLEERASVQQGAPVTGLIPPCFTYNNDVKPLELGHSFGHLLFIPHAAGISVETLRVHCSQYLLTHIEQSTSVPFLKFWQAGPLLITGQPSFLPFPLPSLFKALSTSPTSAPVLELPSTIGATHQVSLVE